MLYHAAALIAEVDPHGQPVRVDLYRQGPYDALLILSGGRSIGLIRHGPTLSLPNLRYRFGAMERLRYAERPTVVLILTHSAHAMGRTVRALDIPIDHRDIFVAREAVVLAADADEVVWQGCGNGVDMHPPVSIDPTLSLRAAMVWLDDLIEMYGVRGDGVRLVPDPDALYTRVVRSTMPDPPAQLASALAVRLTGVEKTALDLIAAWPLCTRKQLAGLMGGVTSRRVNQTLRSLVLHGLVRSDGPHLVLTDDGLACLARRDRTSVGQLLGRWSAALIETNKRKRSVYAGTALRALASQIRHQSGIIEIAASLTAEASSSPDYDLIDLLPTARAAIPYHHNGADYVILPDASFTLEHCGRCHLFLLEFERRATTPRRVPVRLRSYRRYFRSGYPGPDHGDTLPTVLFVFESYAAEDAFLRAAGNSAGVPFLTSNADTLAASGVLGRSWRLPLPRTPDRSDPCALDSVTTLRTSLFPALPSTHSPSRLRAPLRPCQTPKPRNPARCCRTA